MVCSSSLFDFIFINTFYDKGVVPLHNYKWNTLYQDILILIILSEMTFLTIFTVAKLIYNENWNNKIFIVSALHLIKTVHNDEDFIENKEIYG